MGDCLFKACATQQADRTERWVTASLTSVLHRRQAKKERKEKEKKRRKKKKKKKRERDREALCGSLLKTSVTETI